MTVKLMQCASFKPMQALDLGANPFNDVCLCYINALQLECTMETCDAL